MSKEGPPSYEQSQGMANPYNPTYPNAGQIGFQLPTNPNFEKSPSAPYPVAEQPHPGAGQPYPGAGQPYPGAGQPYPDAGKPYPSAGQPYPNAGQPYPSAGQPYPGPAQPYPGAGQPYPGSGQPYHGAGQQYPSGPQPYPMEMQATPVYVAGVQNTGHSVQVAVPVILAAGQRFGPHPTTVYCPSCKENVCTKVRKEPGIMAWVSCGALLLLGCWAGCCLFPFCIDGCKDVYHNCPKCNTFFGKYSQCN